MLKIWGRANSSNVQKVLWCCAELGVAYDRVDIGGNFGGNRDPAYLALNPNGLVPTIEDDGFVLWESNAILRYLSAKHGMGKLCPTDPRQRADADRWMDWATTTVAREMTPIFFQYVRTPPEKRDQAVIEAGIAKAGAAWRILDAHLANRRFVAGDALTMGDIPLGIQAHRWFSLPIPRPALAALEAWYKRLCERPAYRQFVMPPMS